MSVSREKAESIRKDLRACGRASAKRIEKAVGKEFWEATGDHQTILNLLRNLEDGFKREEQYARIIRTSSKKTPARKCAACEKRKLRALIKTSKSKFRSCDREACLAILADICELWPDFKKVPDRLWNLYIDSTGICRCGRPLAPKIVSRSPKAAHCCSEHAQRWAQRKSSERYTQKAAERRALAEAL